MKTTKRILAVALALALGLALLAPAALAAVDPNAPVITRQPVGPHSIRINKTFTLSVQANAPDCAPGTLSYQWFNAINDAPIATGSSVTLTSAFDDGNNVGNKGVYSLCTYYVVVTNTYVDEDGATQSASIQSESVSVTIINSLRAAGLVPFQTGNFLYDIILFPLSLFNYFLFVYNSFMYSFI